MDIEKSNPPWAYISNPPWKPKETGMREMKKKSLQNSLYQSFLYAKNAFNQEKEHRKLMEGRKELLLHSQRLEEHSVLILSKRSHKYYLNLFKSIWSGKLKIICVDYVNANGSRKTGFWFTFDSNSWFFFPRLILPNYDWMK